MITALVFTWIVVLVLCWLGWQLLRQNGRLLLRLEAIEERLNEMEFGDASAPEGLASGSVAPEFDLPDLTGARRTLAQFRNQTLLLIFFNPDCGYCRDLAPKLAEFTPHPVPLPVGRGEGERSPGEGSPLPLIITTGDAEKNRQFFAEQKITSPVLLQNDGELAKAYQANGTPTGYLVSTEGKIASELAVGAEALLALADGSTNAKPLTPSLSPSDRERVSEGRVRGVPAVKDATSSSESDRASRFSHRLLARSKIARDGLKAGTPAPSFRLPRLDGRGELALEDLRGHKVLLVFSDPHCGPCDVLAPKLEQWRKRNSANARTPSPQPSPPGEGERLSTVEVVMISRGEPRENRAKLKQLGLTFPVVLQQQWEISRRYAMFATPIAYIIDEAGVIMHDVAMGEDAILSLLTEARTPVAFADRSAA
jgi:peroxiredoxin